MADRFRVLLVDDGELDDVRDCLLSLGAEFAHLRGGAVPAKLDAPRDLFVTTTRHATLARPWPTRRERTPGAHRGRERGLRHAARDAAPHRIHVPGAATRPPDRAAPAAAARALPRRGATRASRASRSAIRVVAEDRHATPRRAARRSRRERLPRAHRGGDPASRRRSACRCRASSAATTASRCPAAWCAASAIAPSPADGSYAVAIQFSSLGDSALSLLDEALAAHQLGAASARDRSDAAAAPRTAHGDEAVAAPRATRPAARRRLRLARSATPRARPPTATPTSGIERRKQPRAQYSNRVVAAAADGSLHRVLIGRDLSAGGMRVDRQKDLGVGSTLRIALYDPTRETPVVVMATVLRDDGEHGLALRFDDLAPEIADAPRADRRGAAARSSASRTARLGSMGTVVSEILG